MKTLTFALVLSVIVLPCTSSGGAAGPVDKGSISLGGAACFASAGGELHGDDRMTTIALNPSVLYFVVGGLAIGGEVRFTRMSSGDESDTSWGVGPKLAYFFFGGTDSPVHPFVAASYDYSRAVDWYTASEITCAAGAAFMVARNVALTGEAFYAIESSRADGADASLDGDVFGLRLGIATFIF